MKRLTLGLAVLVLTGCIGQGVVKPGGTAYKWIPSSGGSTLVTEKCPANKKCAEVAIAAAPPGLEAYSYVWKLKHRALVGIPYGEEPITVYVLGAHAECMRVSATHIMRKDGQVNEGSGRLSDDPADRCAGPVWVRE